MDKHKLIKGARILRSQDSATRGELLSTARNLERQGHKIIYLNYGNPPEYGFEPPEEIILDLNANIRNCTAYTRDSSGLFSARKAVMQYAQVLGIERVEVEDVRLTDGVTQGMRFSLEALLNPGDEVLMPAPNYPVWTRIAKRCGARVVFYLCDEKSDWFPEIKDMARKVTRKTKAIVIINPNNPTGAVYPKEILEAIVKIAQENGLVIISDEIYDKVLFDNAHHIAIASLADDVLFITLNGLAKNYRLPGFKAGWMIISGAKKYASDYIKCLDNLMADQLCANVVGQSVIQTALGGYQSIKDLVKKGGRLYRQRELVCSMLNKIPSLSCFKPKGAFYVFPKIDIEKYGIKDDKEFCLNFLKEKHVQIAHGTGFDWPFPDHFRITFLEREEELKEAIERLADFLLNYNGQ